MDSPKSDDELTQAETERAHEMMSEAISPLRTAPRIHLDLEPKDAVALVANVQLALRHPKNRGVSADLAREVVDQILAQLPAETREFMLLGYDPRFDFR